MHVPVIEIYLHNIYNVSEAASIFILLQMFANVTEVNHVVNLKGKKQIKFIFIDEKGFHSLIFVLDEGSWPTSMLVSNKREWNNCFIKFGAFVYLEIIA